MKYISTRGQTAAKPFSEVLLMGLAPDGGLMLPESYPQIDEMTLHRWRSLSYPDLAFEIMSRFIDDIPAEDLKDIIGRTYTQETFGSADITPVRTLGDGIKIKPSPTAPRWRSKTWRCSFWATPSNMCSSAKTAN